MNYSSSFTSTFRECRNKLLAGRTNYERAYANFTWPCFTHFNWAVDWFDVIARGNDRVALRIVGDGSDTALTFEQLRQRSNRLANYLRALGLRRGDRILLMLGNVPQLWELMLAAMKLNCPVIPTTTLMMPNDLRDRVARGGVRAVVTDQSCADRFEWLSGSHLKILASGQRNGWHSLEDSFESNAQFEKRGASRLIEHECVTEAAVVPSPDTKRLAVPKAFVMLRSGIPPSQETALSILRFVRQQTSPFKRIRRIEFADLPKTVSGKIRRIELRSAELLRAPDSRNCGGDSPSLARVMRNPLSCFFSRRCSRYLRVPSTKSISPTPGFKLHQI